MDTRVIYKKLIKAYHGGSFSQEVEDILNEFESKEEGKRVILSSIGVKLDDNIPFIYALSEAITNQKIENKIITCIKDNEEIHCPFKFDNKECVACGKCLKDNDNITYTKSMIPILSLLKEKKKVIALVAPSIAGQFRVSKEKLREALKCIGFIDMLDVAFGADILTLIEAYNYNQHIDKADLILTSCCCPVWVAMIRKEFKNFVKYTSPTVSPMIASGRIIKALNKDCYTVFIGPCIAKKQEIKQEDIKDAIDYVITFEELEDTFEALNINPQSFEEKKEIEYSTRSGLLYPASGGISEACKDVISELYPERIASFKSKSISGTKECKEMLKTIVDKEVKENFIEGLACEGGCVNGPKVLVDKALSKACSRKVAYESSYKTPLQNKVLMDLLDKLNIHSLDELANLKMFHREF